MSIASEIARLQQAKSDLATSIANKGVTVPAATTIDGYAALVDQIQTGGGTDHPIVIEYLEGTGTQWINTGITNITATDYFSFTAAKTSTTSAMAFGWSTTSYYNLNLHHTGQQKIELAWGAAGKVIRTDLNEINTFHTYSTAIASSRVYFYVDGTSKGYVAAPSDSGNHTIYMFARQTDGEVALISPMKIKHFIYFRNNIPLRDFIPVRVGQVGYMYDRVSGTLFGNAGTGSFTLGPDVT